jgi:hypothetical protein
MDLREGKHVKVLLSGWVWHVKGSMALAEVVPESVPGSEGQQQVAAAPRSEPMVGWSEPKHMAGVLFSALK